MVEQSQSIPSSLPSMDLLAIRSRIEELTGLHKRYDEDIPESNPLYAEKLLQDSALELETRLQQIVSECSDVGFLEDDELDAYLEHLKEEHNKVESESANLVNEIELLTNMHNEGEAFYGVIHVYLENEAIHLAHSTAFLIYPDSNLLEAKLEEVKCSLDYITSKDQETAKASEGTDSHILEDNQSALTTVHQGNNLELLELDNQIDEMKSTLKSLQDLKHMVQWSDVVEQIEGALTGLKVLSLDENCIRLSLQTYMPNIDATEVHHELRIEVSEGDKLKNVQVFPNDIYVNDIVDTAKSLSKSSLQWLIRKVQDRIILSTVRRLVVKDANKSRYSLEYLDRDETIVAHMAGGIDAFIKLSHSWPITNSPLKLISLKGSDNLKEISLSFLCKVEKVVNSSDSHIRQNIPSFVDAIEKILIEQMQLDLHADDSSAR
ncbi:cation/H(+) antiporter 4-like [Senna tora]|uniref:Cation/H(+) antiporter 4-like n=1 Tax=Senna tora TaxID=362788 RepID=A0A834X3J5_9FABA|nr:cation/H(+) antiporter 4-like [Senna tora]